MINPEIERLKEAVRAVMGSAGDVRDGDAKAQDELLREIDERRPTIEHTQGLDVTAGGYRDGIVEDCVLWRRNHALAYGSPENDELRKGVKTIAARLNDRCHALLAYLKR